MQRIIVSVLLAALAAGAAAAAEKEKAVPAESKGAELIARITEAYMDGNLEELDKALAARPAEMARLNRTQRADVEYVRQALVECRPPWWIACKSGKKASFQVQTWGRPLSVTCDPDAKGETQLKANEARATVTLGPEATALDSPDTGENGFLKGDLAGLGIWQTLGSADGISGLTPKNRVIIGDKDRLRLGVYLDFRGNLTAVYYGTPPIRRWGLHIFLAAYMPEYGKGPGAAPRKAVASMLLAEILKSPAAYPSLPLPDTLEAEGAEAKLATHYKFMIGRKSAWTLAEDKAFRLAVKSFAFANEQKVLDAGGKVTLPNNLLISLMPDEDGALQAQRDKFVKTAFDKIKASAK
jgi:hypothetical protein